MSSNNPILQKLDGLTARFEEVSTLITDPEVIADRNRFVRLTKEYKGLEELLAAKRDYEQLLANLDEARSIVMNDDDPDLKEMAREEIAAGEERLPALEEQIKLMLVPADPEDAKNAIVEIRGGTGGDEAALFAGDLYRMYAKYCEIKGWGVAVSSVSEGTSGGFKEIIFTVTGDNVYGTLKYESGVHRVQRVPQTETQGRVHTSAATVAVLPEADEFDVEINEGEIRWDTFRSSGAGGQNVNKVNSAVRATHLPTGGSVFAQDSRSQLDNKKLALNRLREKLAEMELQQLAEQAQNHWNNHTQVQRGNPVRTFKGTDFKSTYVEKSYKKERAAAKKKISRFADESIWR